MVISKNPKFVFFGFLFCWLPTYIQRLLLNKGPDQEDNSNRIMRSIFPNYLFLSSARSFYRLVCPSVGLVVGLSYSNISQKSRNLSYLSKGVIGESLITSC